jgi:hypothetical protein
MKPIQRNEVLDLGEYETIRPRFRARVIDEKKRRRVAVGPEATAVFENRDTVLLQIQEMLRTERITRESGIAHEIETYNTQIPAEDELSCTLMIAELPERDARDQKLHELRGVEKTVGLWVDGERYGAVIDPKFLLDDMASAVMFLKFPLAAGAVKAIREAGAGTGSHTIELRIEHEGYRASAALGREVLASVAEDLG